MTGRGHDARSRRRRGRTVLLAALVAALSLVSGLVAAYAAPGQATTTLFDMATPKLVTENDTRSVIVGTRFSVSQAGAITSLRFYKGPSNVGPHPMTLWSANGTVLATATPQHETAAGWQVATLATAVQVAKGATLVVSYRAPRGGYSADQHFFDRAYRRGPLTVPRGGGVYRYGTGGFPTNVYAGTNYYVDAGFQPSTTTTPAVPTTVVPSTVVPTTVATALPTTPPTTPPPTPAAPGATTANVLDLPRVPWNGGPAYWAKFSKANAAGWADPSFFPIGVWWASWGTDADVKFDKSVGINTYTLANDQSPYGLLEKNGMFWVGDPLNGSFTAGSRNWVGRFLDDEVDGRYEPGPGRAYLQKLLDSYPKDGRFTYTNYTSMIINQWMSDSDANAYVNNFADATSIDMYWYSGAFCDWSPYAGAYYFILPVKKENCRTSSSYGQTMDALRSRDASDGRYGADFNFVEAINGSPGEGPFVANLSGEKVRGAVMNSIIHEARGVYYFPQSLTGSCQSSNIVRDVQLNPSSCGAAAVNGMRAVDAQIAQLAPVINTQSYRYTFGTGLDTMLKVSGGYAYVFSMVDKVSQPGSRTFTLPAGVTGTSAEVLFENRAVPVNGNTFSDRFAAESAYHIYKIKL